MTTLQTQIPDQLLQQAQYLGQQGWIANIDELIAEAMRRYLESHCEHSLSNSSRMMSIGACMDKAKPVVVADSGSIIHLDELDCLDVLNDFEKVYVPEKSAAPSHYRNTV